MERPEGIGCVPDDELPRDAEATSRLDTADDDALAARAELHRLVERYGRENLAEWAGLLERLRNT